MGWRDHEGKFVGHQNEPHGIVLRVYFQVTEDESQDAQFIATVEKELRLQFGSTLKAVLRDGGPDSWR